MRAWRVQILAAPVACTGLGAAAGFTYAADGGDVTVATGTFYVGDHVASAAANGSAFGIRDSVAWLDSNHVWVSCLS
jgi:hypothetical protein